MKTKHFSLILTSILALVVLAGIVTASLDLTLINGPTTATHNSDVTITFNVTNSGSTNYTALNWSGSTTNIGTWKTLPILTSLIVGETKTLTAVLNIPLYSYGTINSQIDLQNGTSSQVQLNIPSITINISKSLNIIGNSISAGSNSTTITIKNEGNVELTNIDLTSTGDFDVSFSTNGFNLAKGISQSITVTGDQDDLNDLIFGSVIIRANASDGTTNTATVTLSNQYCDYSNLGGDLELDVEINNKEGFGDDESWYPFDEIEIEVTVENTGDYDIDKIEVKWGLYNTDTNEFLFEEEESKFNLKDGDDKTLILNFKLDEKIDDLDGNFVFYVKATGEYDDNNAPNDGESTCVSDDQSVEVVLDEFMILNDLKFFEVASCGSELQITGEVWNTGDSDEEDVYLIIYNQELGIDKKIELGDIDAYDDVKFEAMVNIPLNAKEKAYQLSFEIYDEDDDLFENSEDDESIFKYILTVSGNCNTNLAKAVVSATLESGGKAGKPLVIKSTITNTGTSLVTYTLAAGNYADWAESAELSQSVLVLGAGESKEVEVTLDVKKDVSGEKTFNIEVSSGFELLLKQPVEVSIEKAGFLSGITGNVIGDGNNWYIWAIGAINVILVIVIILVALRIAKN